jgi:hypothetical protein
MPTIWATINNFSYVMVTCLLRFFTHKAIFVKSKQILPFFKVRSHISKKGCWLRHMTVCPSLRPALGPHCAHFHAIWYLCIFRKSVQKISTFFKIWKEWQVRHKKPYVHLYLAKFFLEWAMFHTTLLETIKTHVLCSIMFFLRKSCLIWDEVGKQRKSRTSSIWKYNRAHAHFMVDN